MRTISEYTLYQITKILLWSRQRCFPSKFRMRDTWPTSHASLHWEIALSSTNHQRCLHDVNTIRMPNKADKQRVQYHLPSQESPTHLILFKKYYTILEDCYFILFKRYQPIEFILQNHYRGPYSTTHFQLIKKSTNIENEKPADLSQKSFIISEKHLNYSYTQMKIWVRVIPIV